MKKATRILYVFVAVLTLAACSSLPKDEILARSDNLTSRPKWANEEKTFTIENKTVYVLGTHEMPVAGKRLETGKRSAALNAKKGIANAIEQKLNVIFQNAEEGDEMGAEQARFIGAEASKLVASSIRPAGVYWEKVSRVIDADGNRDLIYRIYSRVQMPEADFKKQIEEAIKRNAGKQGISADFAKKVDENWNEMKE